MAKPKAGVADCHEILLQRLYAAIQDPHCFYRYHISDKEKDEQGGQRAVLREQIAEKIDWKAVKECMEILQSIQKQSEESTAAQGVILLQDTQNLPETLFPQATGKEEEL